MGKNGNGLRLFWHGSPPWVATGYGVVGQEVVSRIRQCDGLVDAVAWLPLGGFGHSRWFYDDIAVYPCVDPRDLGESVIDRWVRHFEADLVVSVTDQWVWKTDVWKTFPWMPVAFPDYEPISERLLNNLKKARKALIPTKWGMEALSRAGLKNLEYMPLGVDTEAFYPDSRERALQRTQIIGAARRQGAPYLTEDCLIFGMVARNGSYPLRKGQDIVMEAAGELLKRGHKDFLVYMHSMADASHGGIDMISMVNAYGRAECDERLPRHILFPPPEQLHFGPDEAGYPKAKMRYLYNAMDCLLNPSSWEGFCLPVIEAAACGVPSIVTDVGCQPETGAVGWKIPAHRRIYAPLTDTFVVDPDRRGLVMAMETAMRGIQPEMREKAVRHAKQYDWQRIIDEHWIPLLEGFARSRSAARKGLVAVGG